MFKLSVSKWGLGVHSLGTANQRQLWHVLVGDLKGDGFPSGSAVGHANLDTGLNIEVGYLNLGGENVPVPVVFHCERSLSRLST